MFILFLQQMSLYEYKKIPDLYTKQEILFGFENYSCCLNRQNCLNRNDWVHGSDPKVTFMRIYGILCSFVLLCYSNNFFLLVGMSVALGNCNFHQETYRTCTVRSKDKTTICP